MATYNIALQYTWFIASVAALTTEGLNLLKAEAPTFRAAIKSGSWFSGSPAAVTAGGINLVVHLAKELLKTVVYIAVATV